MQQQAQCGRAIPWRYIMLLVALISGGYAVHQAWAGQARESGKIKVAFGTPDTNAVLHNPAMGWVYYDSGTWRHSRAFWKSQEPQLKFCNTVYWRGPWSDFEPQRGRYIWKYNPTTIRWLKQINAMHLRLAFRVIVNSKAFSKPAKHLSYILLMRQLPQRQLLWRFRSYLSDWTTWYSSRYQDYSIASGPRPGPPACQSER